MIYASPKYHVGQVIYRYLPEFDGVERVTVVSVQAYSTDYKGFGGGNWRICYMVRNLDAEPVELAEGDLHATAYDAFDAHTHLVAPASPSLDTTLLAATEATGIDAAAVVEPVTVPGADDGHGF